jgi:hypothetical protein
MKVGLFKTVVHLYVITRTANINGKRKTLYLEEEDKFTNVSLWTENKGRAGVFYPLTTARYSQIPNVSVKKILSVNV